jgi:hypothetical protein
VDRRDPDAGEDAGGCLVLDEVQPHREQERHEAGEDERQFQTEGVGQVFLWVDFSSARCQINIIWS